MPVPEEARLAMVGPSHFSPSYLSGDFPNLYIFFQGFYKNVFRNFRISQQLLSVVSNHRLCTCESESFCKNLTKVSGLFCLWQGSIFCGELHLICMCRCASSSLATSCPSSSSSASTPSWSAGFSLRWWFGALRIKQSLVKSSAFVMFTICHNAHFKATFICPILKLWIPNLFIFFWKKNKSHTIKHFFLNTSGVICIRIPLWGCLLGWLHSELFPPETYIPQTKFPPKRVFFLQKH